MRGKPAPRKTHAERALGMTRRQIAALYRRDKPEEVTKADCKLLRHLLEPLAEWEGAKDEGTGLWLLRSWKSEKMVTGRLKAAQAAFKRLSLYHDLGCEAGPLPGSASCTLPNGDRWTIALGERTSGYQKQILFWVERGENDKAN